MPFRQKPITKILFLFCIVFFASTGFAQKNKTALLAEHINGLDLFPVYKAAQKNSFIDSIIYNGPFITFCVRFEKPTSDGHYLFEAINDYQKEQIEKKLISNFEENPDAFKKIDLIKPALGKIYELEFRKNQDYIQFQIQSDSLAIRHTGAQLINIGNSEGPAWEFVELKKDNSILVSLEGNLTLIEKRWVIHFAGPRSHPNLKDILAGSRAI